MYVCCETMYFAITHIKNASHHVPTISKVFMVHKHNKLKKLIKKRPVPQDPHMFAHLGSSNKYGCYRNSLQTERLRMCEPFLRCYGITAFVLCKTPIKQRVAVLVQQKTCNTAADNERCHSRFSLRMWQYPCETTSNETNVANKRSMNCLQ